MRDRPWPTCWMVAAVVLAGCLTGAQAAAAVPPETTITAGPAAGSLTNDSTPAFEFTSDQPATFSCTLVSGEASVTGPCSSPFTPGPISDGGHTLSIAASNGAEVDATPASRTFTIDTTPPATSIVDGPTDGEVIDSDAPAFAWGSSEAYSTFSCTADGVALASCSLAYVTGAADGSHTFTIAATDRAGNTDPTPATRTFTIRLTGAPPELPLCQVDGAVAIGTSRADTRIGSAGTDILFGRGGNDLLRGLSGADCLAGAAGDDRLFAGSGDDYISGGSGADQIAGEQGDDALYGGPGSDHITGGPGHDLLVGEGGADRLSDATGHDSFSGGPGNDRIDARDSSAAGRVIADSVKCGSGRFDVALVDRRDSVAADCEIIRRR